jgi:uncharacterized protein
MGLIRLAIFAVVIWMFWRLIKNFLAKQVKMNKKESGKLEQGNIVLCEYCSVHVPEQKAVSHEKLWFCSEKHKENYLSGDD